MVYFQTENPNLGKFWRVLQWKMLVYFMYIWYTYFTFICDILWTFGILFRFGVLQKEKSGNTGRIRRTDRAKHRNLRSRTSILAQVLQIFFGKEHLEKNWLISTLDKVVYFKGTIFLQSTKPLFTSQNRVETS
jgi:hypothetical protein